MRPQIGKVRFFLSTLDFYSSSREDRKTKESDEEGEKVEGEDSKKEEPEPEEIDLTKYNQETGRTL